VVKNTPGRGSEVINTVSLRKPVLLAQTPTEALVYAFLFPQPWA